MEYKKYLEINQIQKQINEILEHHNAQIVGMGYVDIILSRPNAILTINVLDKLSVVVNKISWWCHWTHENYKLYGCPHGMGGPTAESGVGWFSECVGYPIFDIDDLDLEKDMATPSVYSAKCNQSMCHYLENQLHEEWFFSECLWPGIWLDVPDDWKSW